jgi:hypothetical protein
MDPLVASAPERFQTGFSLILFVLSGCIAIIELLRHAHGLEAWGMGVLLGVALVLSKRVAGELRRPSTSASVYISPEQIVRAK